MARLPPPRGPVSDALFGALRRPPHVLAAPAGEVAFDDLQLALFVLQELHYRGVDGVDDDREWQPGVVALRRLLEGALEQELRARVPLPSLPAPHAPDVAAALFALTAADQGPSLSRYAARHATLEQLREMLMLKSVYQLKEADPHTWSIPRLTGRAKAGRLPASTVTGHRLPPDSPPADE